MFQIDPTEVAIVKEHLAKAGIPEYTIAPGNNCIRVTYGRVSEYYIFRNGKLIDIQTD